MCVEPREARGHTPWGDCGAAAAAAGARARACAPPDGGKRTQCTYACPHAARGFELEIFPTPPVAGACAQVPGRWSMPPVGCDEAPPPPAPGGGLPRASLECPLARYGRPRRARRWLRQPAQALMVACLAIKAAKAPGACRIGHRETTGSPLWVPAAASIRSSQLAASCHLTRETRFYSIVPCPYNGGAGHVRTN